jgi:hypothetical protein
MESTNGASQNGETHDADGFPLKFCTVCASNQNRCVDNRTALWKSASNQKLYLIQIHGRASPII